MFHLFSIHDIKKEFQTIFQGSVPHFRRGGLEIGLIFFPKELGVLREDKCTERFIMYNVTCWNGSAHES